MDDWPWLPIDQNLSKFCVALHSYSNSDNSHLKLLTGDLVYLLQHNACWFYGHLVTNESVCGIFPKKFVHILDDNDREEPVATGPPVLTEIQHTVPVWFQNIHQKYVELFLPKPNLDEAYKILKSLREISQQLESGKLTAGECLEYSRRATVELDKGNVAFDMDTVLRTSDCDKLSTNNLPFINTYRRFEESHRSVNMASISEKNLRYEQYFGIRLELKKFECCACPEDMEVYVSLVNYSTKRQCEFLCETACLYSAGVQRAENNINSQQLDLFFTEFCKANSRFGSENHMYLVFRVVRDGQLENKKSNKTNKRKENLRRPYGYAFLDVTSILESGTTVDKSLPIKVVQGDEKTTLDEFIKLYDSSATIDSRTGYFNIKCCKVLLPLDNEILTRGKTNRKLIHLKRINPSLDMVMYSESRNELYITINSAEFERGKKQSEHNMEVRVFLKDGSHDKADIVNNYNDYIQMHEAELHGSLPALHTDHPQYRTTIHYHNSHPRWDETIRINLDSLLKSDKLPDLHLHFELMHRSRTLAKDQHLGYCILPLFAAHSSKLLLPNEFSKRLKIQRGAYAAMPKRMSVMPKHLLRTAEAPKEDYCLLVSSVLHSTELSNVPSIHNLLNYKNIMPNCEQLVVDSDDLEIIRFFPRLLSASLDIIADEENVKLSKAAFLALTVFLKPFTTRQREEMWGLVLKNISIVCPKASKPILQYLVDQVENFFNKPNQTMITDFPSILKYVLQIFNISVKQSNYATFTQPVHLLFETLFKYLMQADINPNNPSHLQFIRKFFDDYVEIFLETVDANFLSRYIFQFLRRSLELGLPHLTVKFDKIVENKSFWNSDIRSDLVRFVIGFIMDFWTAKSDNKESKNSLDILQFVLRPLHEVVYRLNIFPPEEVFDTTVILCCKSGFFRELIQTCICSTFKYPYHKMELNPQLSDLKFLRIFLAAIFSCLELMNRSPEAWDAWIRCHFEEVALLPDTSDIKVRKIDRNGNGAFCDLWDLQDATLELLQFLNAIFIKLSDRWLRWNDLKIKESKIALTTLNILSKKIIPKLSNFSSTVVVVFFDVLFSFIQQSHLVTGNMSLYKRHQQNVNSEKDLRLQAFELLQTIWNDLNDQQKNGFVPALVNSLVEVSLQPLKELRKKCCEFLVDMIVVDKKMSVNGNYDIMTNELILRLDRIVEKDGNKSFVDDFHFFFCESLNKHKSIDNQKKFTDDLRIQMNLLLEYQTLISDELPENRMFAIYNLHKFYKGINKEQMCDRYLYKLCLLHEHDQNWIEAGCVLLLQAKFLDWDFKKPLNIPKDALQARYQEFQTHAELKESLLLDAIDFFTKGKLYHKAKKECEELWKYYRTMLIDYSKERKVLLKLSELCQSITDPEVHQENKNYFLIEFIGNRFPHFLVNQKFVYNAYMKQLASVMQDFDTLFPYAKIPQGQERPTDKNANIIEITNLTPNAILPEEVLASATATYDVLHYYRYNEVRQFTTRKMIKRTEEVTEKVCHVETFETMEAFPSVLKLLPAKLVSSETECPMTSAIRDLTAMNDKVCYGIYALRTGREPSKMLIGLVSGIINANVGGGISKYYKFFTQDIDDNNPAVVKLLNDITKLLGDQLQLITEALELAKFKNDTKDDGNIHAFGDILCNKIEEFEQASVSNLHPKVKNRAKNLGKKLPNKKGLSYSTHNLHNQHSVFKPVPLDYASSTLPIRQISTKVAASVQPRRQNSFGAADMAPSIPPRGQHQAPPIAPRLTTRRSDRTESQF